MLQQYVSLHSHVMVYVNLCTFDLSWQRMWPILDDQNRQEYSKTVECGWRWTVWAAEAALWVVQANCESQQQYTVWEQLAQKKLQQLTSLQVHQHDLVM